MWTTQARKLRDLVSEITLDVPIRIKFFGMLREPDADNVNDERGPCACQRALLADDLLRMLSVHECEMLGQAVC